MGSHVTLRTMSLACVLCAGLGIATQASAATHTVVIEALAFAPPTLTVKRGDTVVWVNKDPFPHTVTAVDKSFDSGEIAAGKRWKYTAKKAGAFTYICTLHTTMKGTLMVK